LESYLQTVPEEHRAIVEPHLREHEKNVNGRLSEAAEFRKTWEPFSKIDGLSQYEPDNLTQLLAWHQQIVSNPDAYRQWLEQATTEAGLTLAEQQALESDEDGDLTPEKVQQLVEQQAQQQLAPLQQRLEQFEAQQAEATEETAIRNAFDEIEGAEKLSFSEDQKEMIYQLGLALAVDEQGNPLPMGDASWVKAGFDRFREMSSAAQRAFVADKTGVPGPPLTTGGASTVLAPKTFDEADKLALGRLRQQS